MTPINIHVLHARAAAILKAYASEVQAIATDKRRAAWIAGHLTAADKALRYLLLDGAYSILSDGSYQFPSSRRDEGPWVSDGETCDCPGDYGHGRCWHRYAVRFARPYDAEIARAAEREARRQNAEELRAIEAEGKRAQRVAAYRQQPSRISVGQHLTDDPQGAVYRSLTLRAPETVRVAANSGVVDKATADKEASELFQ